jgi:hypothetical protein
MTMANLSTARKLSILARVAAQQAGRTRHVGALMKAGRATAAHVGRVLHQLWLEVTGFVFLTLAFIGGTAMVREGLKYRAGETTLTRVVTAVCFTGLFGWFGLSSFWRVWKKG